MIDPGGCPCTACNPRPKLGIETPKRNILDVEVKWCSHCGQEIQKDASIWTNTTTGEVICRHDELAHIDPFKERAEREKAAKRKPRTKGQLLDSLPDMRVEYPSERKAKEIAKANEVKLADELLPGEKIKNTLAMWGFFVGWLASMYFMFAEYVT